MAELLTIGEVARRSGVAASALRYYEDRGLIASERTGAAHRRYPRAVIRRVAFIVFAQRVGLTLDEIGEELAKLPTDRVPNRRDWARLSGTWQERIDERIDELRRLPDAGPLPLRESRRPPRAPRAWPGRLDPAMKLERHPSLDERYDPQIVIVDHDAAWAHSAQAEMRRIAGALGAVAVRIDHVGSTSVPGLAAKPIVDLQVSVPDVEDLEAYVGPLERLGYLFVPDPQSPDFHYFALPARRPRTHHVHVCQAGSDHERRHLALRDFLRAHP